MNSDNNRSGSFGGALRGLLFIRIRELVTPRALSRYGIIVAICLVLMWLVNFDDDGAQERFKSILGTVFALRFLPIFCLTKGGESLRNELKEGTIEYLWVRPASKVELYLGFYLGGLLSVWSVVGPCLIGISLGSLWFGLASFGDLQVIWLGSLVVTAAFTAISGALSTFSSKFVVLGMFYFGFIELGLGEIPNGIQKLAVTFHTEALFSSVTQTGFGEANLAAYLWTLGITVAMLLAGAAIFRSSHYVIGGEKDG